MSVIGIIIFGAGCFVLGFTLPLWLWLRAWVKTLDAERARIEADAERIRQHIAKTEESIQSGARRSKGRFQL